MKRSALFTIALLLISGLAFGQATITSSGQATTSGVAVPVAPIVSPPLLVTPTAQLSNAPTQPSMTGLSALTQPQQPTPPSSRANIEFGPPAAVIVPETSGTEAQSAAASPINGAEAAPAFTMGVNSSAATPSDGLHGQSLGEIARQLRGNMQNANAKMYTNADVEKLPAVGGITGGATTANAAQPNGTYPVGNNGVIMQNGQPLAGGQAVANEQNPAATSTGVAQPATEQNQPATAQPPAMNNQQSQPGTMNALPPTQEQQTAPQQKPSATVPPPQQMAQAATPQNPADQNASASSARGEREPANNPQQTLPRSASLLPLIALVGAGATVAGLLARK